MMNKPREISIEQLQEVLERHREWVESKGKKGKRASLARTKLWGANLEGANLSSANLVRATLSGADLEKADLKGANLRKAYCMKVNLQGADLTNATGLTAAQVEAAVTDEETRLPAYLA